MGLLILAVWLVALSAQTKADPGKGNEVFDEQCAQCHSAYSDERKTGPSLKFLFDRMKEPAVRDRIDKGGNGMPAFNDTLSSDDKENLLAYLKTL